MGIFDMLAGAAQGGGKALMDVGQTELEASIQKDRDARLREWKNTDTIAAEERAPANAAAMVEAQTPGLLDRAQGVSDIGVEAHKKTAVIDTQQRVKEFEQLAPLKRQEAIDTEVAKVKALATPEMLRATRAIAQAGHIVDPNHSLVPNADGTVTVYDSTSGKGKGLLKGADGKPIVRKDSEGMKAAAALINDANTELRIAQAAYKVDSDSLEEGAKEKADAAWAEAQRTAKEQKAPAIALIYQSANIPGVKAPPAADDGVAAPKTPEEKNALPPGTRYRKPGDPNVYVTPAKKEPEKEAKKAGILGNTKAPSELVLDPAAEAADAELRRFKLLTQAKDPNVSYMGRTGYAKRLAEIRAGK